MNSYNCVNELINSVCYMISIGIDFLSTKLSMFQTKLSVAGYSKQPTTIWLLFNNGITIPRFQESIVENNDNLA